MKEDKKIIANILKKNAEREDKFENQVLNLALKKFGGAQKDEQGVFYSKKKKHLIMASKTIEGTYEIEDGVQIIDDNAFWGCAYLERLVIPETVVEIGNEAFGRCLSLKQLVIPKSVSVMGNNPFVGLNAEDVKCESENFVIEGKMLYSADKKTLYACLTDAQMVIIPKTVEVIQDLALTRRRKLKKVVIPEGVRFIGNEAFADYDALEEVSIPATVETIEAYAFAECDNLKTVTFAGEVKSLSRRTFSDCDRLQHIYVPRETEKKFIKQLHLTEENEDIIIGKAAEN